MRFVEESGPGPAAATVPEGGPRAGRTTVQCHATCQGGLARRTLYAPPARAYVQPNLTRAVMSPSPGGKAAMINIQKKKSSNDAAGRGLSQAGAGKAKAAA